MILIALVSGGSKDANSFFIVLYNTMKCFLASASSERLTSNLD
jgi:hypothetical protein